MRGRHLKLVKLLFSFASWSSHDLTVIVIGYSREMKCYKAAIDELAS